MPFEQWLQERVEKTKVAGLYRELRTIENVSFPEICINGNKQIVFSSNNYLGLAGDMTVVEKAKEVWEKFGNGSTGSRLTTGNTIWHERLEERIAAYKETEAALLFSSGYLANIGVLSSLTEEGDVILSDALNHASLIDGCRLSKAETKIYEHRNMNDLERKLQNSLRYHRRFIVTDGVFSMDGTIAPLDKIKKLAERYDAFLIVDDAHATGVIGEQGKGTAEYFQVAPDVIIGTLSKAVGTEGGFVAGSQSLKEFLIQHARTFIFQTAIPPASCSASLVALEKIERETDRRKQLFQHVRNIRETLTAWGFTLIGDLIPIIPVWIGDEKRATIFSDKLQEKGIYAPAIRPPTVPEGECRIRLTVMSQHSSEDVSRLLDAFEEIGREMELIQ